jgi:predicted RNA-binding protein with RPS1 domain
MCPGQSWKKLYLIFNTSLTELLHLDEVAIDFPEDVKIPIESNQMVTAQVVGSSLNRKNERSLSLSI